MDEQAVRKLIREELRSAFRDMSASATGGHGGAEVVLRRLDDRDAADGNLPTG